MIAGQNVALKQNTNITLNTIQLGKCLLITKTSHIFLGPKGVQLTSYADLADALCSTDIKNELELDKESGNEAVDTYATHVASINLLFALPSSLKGAPVDLWAWPGSLPTKL